MPLAIMNDYGDEVVRVFPDIDESGLVCVRKQLMSDGTWALLYGNEIVLGGLASEASADTKLASLGTHLNTRQSNSYKTVAQIEALP